MPTLYTTPSLVPVAKSEKIPIAVSFAAMILAGDALASPTSAMYEELTGNAVSLTDPPTLDVDGVSVDQIIRGSALTANTNYRLDVTVTLNANKIVTGSTNIYCPY